jgi:type IV pilus assembly protein PilM
MPLADMRQMLKFNSKNYLQQDLPDHVFDCYYTLGKQGGKGLDGFKPAPGPLKQKVMVGGARKQTIDDLQTAIKQAGLIPDQVVPGVIGPANALEVTEPELFAKEVVSLVDVGFKNTTITILDSGEIKLNRVVGIGGDRLTSGLAETMNISYVEAENIKVGMPTEVQPNLEALLNPLGRELRASIDFFENQQDKTVSQVLVSGGSARSEFIIQSLQTELMVPCKSWNPTRLLHLALAPEKMGEVEQAAPQLTVAIGAAAGAS